MNKLIALAFVCMFGMSVADDAAPVSTEQNPADVIAPSADAPKPEEAKPEEAK